MTDILQLSRPFRELVTSKFTTALAAKEVIFSETHLTLLQTSWPAIQLRYCPALGKKPKSDKPNDTKKPFDPFENPSELLVASIPAQPQPTHNLVLNKYPVIPNHFILATTANKPQTHILEADDLYLAHACVKSWHDDTHALYAFFNSGEHSGASQPHRHIQFLPVEDMASEGWEVLCSKFGVHVTNGLIRASLPFVHCATDIRGLGMEALHEAYLGLMRACLGELGIQAVLEGEAPFSYNLAMTDEIMAILPRRSEGSSVDGEGFVAINGTILAGTLMVKSEAEWDTLRAKPELVQGVIETITFPWKGRGSL